ncbi:hypothetical protein XENOCAPTIV_020943 [Xenoophorus captivus]|uniref:Uncharacterized protein n=1 Tax=Xenoophorus captivus TaxID=1517983 RepID=A0ABV0R4A0_9TELE
MSPPDVLLCQVPGEGHKRMIYRRLVYNSASTMETVNSLQQEILTLLSAGATNTAALCYTERTEAQPYAVHIICGWLLPQIKEEESFNATAGETANTMFTFSTAQK